MNLLKSTEKDSYNNLYNLAEHIVMTTSTIISSKGWNSGAFFLILINLFLIAIHYDVRFCYGILLFVNILAYLLYSSNKSSSASKQLPIIRSQVATVAVSDPAANSESDNKDGSTVKKYIPCTTINKVDISLAENNAMTNNSWTVSPFNWVTRIGPNYAVNRKKAPCDSAPLFDILGIDVFYSEKKVFNIGRAVQFPENTSTDESLKGEQLDDIPDFFLFVASMPEYPPSLFGYQEDGPTITIVAYARVSDDTKREILGKIPMTPAVKLFLRWVKFDPKDDLRLRSKVISRLVNIDDLAFPPSAKVVYHKYADRQGKGCGAVFLTRPQHEFYRSKKYVEIDLDAHKFMYLARWGWSLSKGIGPDVIFDIGFLLEGITDDELPERMIGGVRLAHCDFNKAPLFTIDLPPAKTGGYPNWC